MKQTLLVDICNVFPLFPRHRAYVNRKSFIRWALRLQQLDNRLLLTVGISCCRLAAFMKNQPLVPLLNLLLSLHVFLNVAGVLASSDRPSSSPLPSPLPLPLPENRASHAKIKSAVDHERPSTGDKSEVSPELFAELEELSRIADISYCVGMMGIERPFECANRCSDFDGFELVTVST